MTDAPKPTLTEAEQDLIDEMQLRGFNRDRAETIVRDMLAAREAATRREALPEAAEDLIAELVCCDVYERLSEKSTTAWTPEERQEYQHHSICYWGNASAELVRNRAALTEPDRIEDHA